MNEARAAWESWCEDRNRSVQAIPGNLALISYQAVEEAPEPIDELEALSVRREGQEQAVRITIPEGIEATIDGSPVSGEVVLERLRADGTPILAVGSYRVDAFSLDGTDFELRIYDEAAENLDNFAGIDVYDYDPNAVVQGRFTERAETDAVAWDFTRSSDAGHTKQVPGDIEIDLDGTTHRLTAFQDGGELVLVFADGTTGSESYAPGRFLRVPRPAGSQDLSVDFNRAFIPPCGFSDFYSCPIPPEENKLPVAIRAGEKRVQWKRERY